jgi:hypothetical protein
MKKWIIVYGCLILSLGSSIFADCPPSSVISVQDGNFVAPANDGVWKGPAYPNPAAITGFNRVLGDELVAGVMINLSCEYHTMDGHVVTLYAPNNRQRYQRISGDWQHEQHGFSTYWMCFSGNNTSCGFSSM